MESLLKGRFCEKLFVVAPAEVGGRSQVDLRVAGLRVDHCRTLRPTGLMPGLVSGIWLFAKAVRPVPQTGVLATFVLQLAVTPVFGIVDLTLVAR